MNQPAPHIDPVPPPLVLYDDDCALCRTLAGFLQRRAHGAFRVKPWQEFARSPEGATGTMEKSSSNLRVFLAGSLLEGEAAWDYLLENYHDMDGLNWIAQRLGLRRETAVVLDRAGHALRRLFCRRCSR